jgi:hypothetical protein
MSTPTAVTTAGGTLTEQMKNLWTVAQENPMGSLLVAGVVLLVLKD